MSRDADRLYAEAAAEYGAALERLAPDRATWQSVLGVRLANRMRGHLPLLLALSVNSPFWQARPTGLASTRTKVFEAFPRSGLPPAFASYEEFELLVERGIRTNSFPDYTYIWWDLRPHPRLGTIELRICDAQTRIDSVAAVVALTQSLVATLAASFEAGDKPAIQPRIAGIKIVTFIISIIV